MPIFKQPPTELIEAMLGQKSELISDVGLNFHKGGPVSLDGLIRYQDLPNRNDYTEPLRKGRLIRTGNSAVKTVEMKVNIRSFSNSLREIEEKFLGLDELMQYHVRLQRKQVDDEIMSVVTLQPKKRKAELLAMIGSSPKIHRLIWSGHPRKQKRGWRLYRRNQK